MYSGMINKYLILKGCAGLGNRFLAIKDAIDYAKKTDRILYVDWSDGWFLDKGINTFYQYFDLCHVKHITNIEPIINAFENGASTYPANLSRKDLEEDIYSNYFFKNNTINPYLYSYCHFINKTAWSYLFYGGYWYRTVKSVKNPLKKIVTPFDPRNKMIYGAFLSRTERNEDIVCFADFGTFENRNNMFSHIKMKEFMFQHITKFASDYNLSERIAIHIRATDKKPSKSISNLLEIIEQTYLPQAKGIFLSTDNPAIEGIFHQRFPDKVICFPKEMPNIGTDNVGSPNFGGIHHWIRNKSVEKKKALFEATLADMWLLSMCKYLLWQGNSSFSMMSAELMNKKSNIIDWTSL